MNAAARTRDPHALGVSTAVTVIVAGWFALTFAIALGGLFLGA